MKKGTKKTIMITPEWLLISKCKMAFRDDQNIAYILVDNVYNWNWIDLALRTLGVKYSYFEYPKIGEISERWTFEFPIEEVRNVCPNFYAMFMERSIWIDEMIRRGIDPCNCKH